MLQALELHQASSGRRAQVEGRHSLAADLWHLPGAVPGASLERSRATRLCGPTWWSPTAAAAHRLSFSAICWIARSSTIANTISPPAAATSRTGSTCLRPSPRRFFPRCINAPTLASLVDCDAGYSATHWQKQSFPARFQSRIEVLFDGIDTELYRPGPAPRKIGGRSIPEDTKIVTFVSRGLESIRGFDLFMQVADRISRREATCCSWWPAATRFTTAGTSCTPAHRASRSGC